MKKIVLSFLLVIVVASLVVFILREKQEIEPASFLPEERDDYKNYIVFLPKDSSKQANPFMSVDSRWATTKDALIENQKNTLNVEEVLYFLFFSNQL